MGPAPLLRGSRARCYSEILLPLGGGNSCDSCAGKSMDFVGDHCPSHSINHRPSPCMFCNLKKGSTESQFYLARRSNSLTIARHAPSIFPRPARPAFVWHIAADRGPMNAPRLRCCRALRRQLVPAPPFQALPGALKWTTSQCFSDRLSRFEQVAPTLQFKLAPRNSA